MNAAYQKHNGNNYCVRYSQSHSSVGIIVAPCVFKPAQKKSHFNKPKQSSSDCAAYSDRLIDKLSIDR